MEEPPPYHLDVESLAEPQGEFNPNSSAAAAEMRNAMLRGRPWVGIHFECCGVYTRIYRNRDGTAYQGCCPRCLRKLRLRIGPEGTDARFFTAW